MSDQTSAESSTELEQLRAELHALHAEREELREQAELLRSILDHAPDIILVIDREGVIQFISRTQREPDVVLGSEALGYLVKAQQEAIGEAIRQVFATGQPVDVEVQEEETGDWYAARLAPLPRNGGPQSAVAICTEISKQKRHEEELRQSAQRLRESEERFRQMAENIQEVFYLFDPRENRALYVNPAYDHVWGRPHTELYENLAAWQEAVHPEDRPRVAAAYSDRVRGISGAPGEFRIIRPDGQVRWIENRSYMIRNREGKLIRVTGTCTDITERKDAEQDLKRARDALRERVDEQTRELRTANRILREDVVQQLKLGRELRETKRQLLVVAGATPIPIAVTRHSDGAVVYANERMAELLKVDVDQLVGRKALEFYVSGADRTRMLALLADKGSVRDIRLQIRRADGEIIWVAASLESIPYDGEDAILAGLVDITAAQHAEESLRQKQKILQRLLDLHERERQLVAYEIHDGLVSYMTGAAMHFEAAQYAAEPANEESQAAYATGAGLLRRSIDEARRMINGLRPPVLETEGLVPAIKGLMQEMELSVGLSVELEHNVRFGRIAPALEMAVYRIIHEALHNTWQHSDSNSARIELVQRVDHVDVAIVDWGVGFDPRTVKQKQYGLRGITERAELMGGSAQIHSKPGEGTRILVRLPLDDVLLADWRELPEAVAKLDV